MGFHLIIIGFLIYFSEDFDFDFANPIGKSLLKVLLEKFEETFPLKAVLGNKMYTIKNHSLNSILCDDNGACTQRRTTKTNYLLLEIKLNRDESSNCTQKQ